MTSEDKARCGAVRTGSERTELDPPSDTTHVARHRQVYQVTFPNGRIFEGLDLTGSVLYFGSPSDVARISADLGEEGIADLTLRKVILWQSQTATDAEARAMEGRLIRETGANDPRIGYNLRPRPREAR